MDNYEKRFWSKVKVTGDKYCWLWQGSVDKGGYGRFYLEGHKFRAHRFVWEMTHGPLNEGQWVLHKCDVRTCCNPAHLYVGNHQDNMNDMKERGRSGGKGKLTIAAIPWTKGNETARKAARWLRKA